MRKLLAFAILLPMPALAQPVPLPPCMVETPLFPWRWRDDAPGPLRVGRPATVLTNRPLEIEIGEAGTYGIALDGPVWVDLARDGQMLASVGHRHRPDCTSVHHIVYFRLLAGTYVINLGRTEAPSARLLVFRQPESPE